MTTESSACCGSTTSALQVDLVRGPASGRILEQAVPDPGREQFDPPELVNLHPAELPQSGLRARRDLGVAPELGLLVPFRRHAHGDVHRMPSLSQELAHVQHSREPGREPRLLRDLTLRALRYRLSRLQPAARQNPVRVPIRLLVAHQEQGAVARHDRPDPDAEIRLALQPPLSHDSYLAGSLVPTWLPTHT